MTELEYIPMMIGNTGVVRIFYRSLGTKDTPYVDLTMTEYKQMTREDILSRLKLRRG